MDEDIYKSKLLVPSRVKEMNIFIALPSRVKEIFFFFCTTKPSKRNDCFYCTAKLSKRKEFFIPPPGQAIGKYEVFLLWCSAEG
jgi:hypothetical protein